jgi:hypothetical protein
MPHTAVLVFTAKNRQMILDEGGSGDWRLDPDRARRSQFLVCAQNRHNPGQELGAPDARHGAAFLIGRIADVVPSEAGRWAIRIDAYIPCDVPDTWQKSGPGRYPVRYTTLEALGIDLNPLLPFRPVPAASHIPGLGEMASTAPLPPLWTKPGRTSRTPGDAMQTLRPDPWARLDTLLDQIDRIPDQPGAFDPLAWDAHGLPR